MRTRIKHTEKSNKNNDVFETKYINLLNIIYWCIAFKMNGKFHSITLAEATISFLRFFFFFIGVI